MKKIFSHPEIVMAVLAVILLCVLASFYYWATDAIVVQVREALMPAPSESVPAFNLTAASKLDLRGLLGQSSSSAAALIPGAGISTPPPSQAGDVQSPIGSPASSSGSSVTDQQILQAFGAASGAASATSPSSTSSPSIASSTPATPVPAGTATGTATGTP